MLNFASDYLEGAHPEILKKLCETNLEKTPGYGQDIYCDAAKEKIKAACKAPDAEVFFLVGGTQSNATVIGSILRPWHGVISADTGHIAGHEAGAIELSGHKVLTIKNRDGKIAADDLAAYLAAFYADATYPHMVQPGMVYISHPTESGTLYTKAELSALKKVCTEYKLPLFLDGARLGYGLAAIGTDVTLPDIAELCDVFYIGGTKCGALFGEAVVFTNRELTPFFFTSIKQHGALLAKGRMLGLQFDVLFTDGLYETIAKHAINMADLLRDELTAKGYTLCYGSPTNQVFVLLDGKKLDELTKKVLFNIWEPTADGAVIRLVTSWATREDEVRELLEMF